MTCSQQGKTKHTPGPWKVKPEIDRGADLTGTETLWRVVAGKEEWFDNKGHFHPDDARYARYEHYIVDCGFDRDYGYPEGGIKNEADAYLIAAAPEMLSALEQVLIIMRGECRTLLADSLEKLIGKARGEPRTDV